MKRLALLLIAAAGAAACNDGLTTFEDEIAGNYTLESIAGDALPVTFIDHDTLQVELTSATLLMGLNGVYREIDNFRVTRATGVTTQVDTFTAVWSPTSNNGLTLTTQTTGGPLTFPGTWDGTRTITFDFDGDAWVWRRSGS